MTAELNSHQRVSYYTGVKLIRHHQNQGNSSSTNAANNSTANPTSTGAGGSSSTGGYFPPHNHHHQHFPIHGPPHHQHAPPPLPPHHPGHFHLPCPTGPPHIQHPGGMLHLSNHHGPPHHPQHQNSHGHQHFGPIGGGGPNHATRLYAGSPLIRSSTFHSMNGNSGNNKKSHKNHHNRGHHIQNGNFQNGHLNSSKFGGGITHSHHPSNLIIRGSCSSGTSSSSSSSEHLNTFQSPTGSPTAPPKLDISPLKLSASPNRSQSASSSSNNSSPGPEGSPSPSAPSASPSSSDGNKDLDHFYFLDEHWKPTNDGVSALSNASGSSSTSGDILDMSSSTSSILSSQWASSSSGSPSPPVSTTLTMMVDQFFATRDNNQVFSNLVDANNNIIGEATPDFNEIGRNPPPRGDQQDLFHNFSTSGFINSGNSCTGASGLFNFGGTRNTTTGGDIFNSRSSLSGDATTVVNVETQIGTFNGQRDLEIRLCFIKGDHNNHRGSGQPEPVSFKEKKLTEIAYLNKIESGNVGERTPSSVIGDPFSTTMKSSVVEHASVVRAGTRPSVAVASTAPDHKEISQQS